MALTEVNQELFRDINDLGKEFDMINPVFVFLAEYMQYFLALALLIFWFTRIDKNRMMVIQAFFAFVLAEVLGKTAGLFHTNYQPFTEMANVNQLIEKEVNNSFPSDHTILFFSICISIWLVRRSKWYIWLTLPVLVGISRIWVGVHYPGDVLAGALLAILSAYIMFRLVPRIPLIHTLLGIYDKAENVILPRKKTRNRDIDQ